MTIVKPTYTHIVNAADAQVQHNFSASGWEYKARHAANHAPYADKQLAGSTFKRGGRTYRRTTPYLGEYRNYSTLCGKNINVDTDFNGNEKHMSNGLEADGRVITCNACRRKLGLKPIPKRKPIWR